MSVSSVTNIKRSAAQLYVSNVASDICCPFFDQYGRLHVLRQSTGAVLEVDHVGNTSSVFNTSGQPFGALFSSSGHSMSETTGASGGGSGEEELLYVADFAHGAILAMSKEQHGHQETVVSSYEDKPMKGPNSLCMVDGDIFFTDSGAMGETGLHSPQGSVYMIGQGPHGRILRPISLNNLAYPAGIAVTRDKKFIYVAEMMQNRILRFFQHPVGVYHGSVFYQLSGGVGPISLVIDHATDQLLVGQFDVRDSSTEGTVLVLSSAGKLLRTISTNGPEISGLAVHDGTLYITERSTGSIYKSELI